MSQLPESLARHLIMKAVPTSVDNTSSYGMIQRAQIIAQHNFDGKKSHSATESPATLFKKFIDAYCRVAARLEKLITGHHRQKLGVFLGGKSGDSRESTAAIPTRDAVFLNDGKVELEELLDLFKLLMTTVGQKIPGDMKRSMEVTKGALFTTWREVKSDPTNGAEFLKEKLEDLKDAAEELMKQERSHTKVVIPRKFAVPGNNKRGGLQTLYFMTATNGKGMFALQLVRKLLDLDASTSIAFKIHTRESAVSNGGSRLFSFSLGVQPNPDQILQSRRYLPGCSYEYVGADEFLQYLPYPPIL